MNLLNSIRKGGLKHVEVGEERGMQGGRDGNSYHELAAQTGTTREDIFCK